MYKIEEINLTLEQILTSYGFWKIMSYIWVPFIICFVLVVCLINILKRGDSNE